MNNLAYNGTNPGSVQYGNFINYYKFHPAEDRIKLLPTDIWQPSDTFVVLDIGCNAGDLTLSLHKYLTANVCKNSKIIAIDIDPILIERAVEQNTSHSIVFQCIDFMDSTQREQLKLELQNLHISKFDVVFCFSVTMWIHLNHGDDGLQNFLTEICNLSDTIVIEPQPWKCYKTAVKRLKLHQKEFFKFKDLKLKDPVTDIENIIIQKGFYKRSELYETNWQRKILIFNKISC